MEDSLVAETIIKSLVIVSEAQQSLSGIMTYYTRLPRFARNDDH
jgi:hypothetical protein